MGATDTTLYTGDIDYVNIPGGKGTYWLLPFTQIVVNGVSVPIPAATGGGIFGSTGGTPQAAIDTGTTLVGGPPEAIAAIFAQIPGSIRGSGQTAGYWTYPCDSQVNVQLGFGSKLWSISPSDFELTPMGNGRCSGSFFELDIGGSAPDWIVGDTFLKNVYSVYRFTPPSVGFATLSDTALAMNSLGGTIPTPSIGANPTRVSGAAQRGTKVVSGSSSALFALAAVGISGVIGGFVSL